MGNRHSPKQRKIGEVGENKRGTLQTHLREVKGGSKFEKIMTEKVGHKWDLVLKMRLHLLVGEGEKKRN